MKADIHPQYVLGDLRVVTAKNNFFEKSRKRRPVAPFFVPLELVMSSIIFTELALRELMVHGTLRSRDLQDNLIR